MRTGSQFSPNRFAIFTEPLCSRVRDFLSRVLLFYPRVLLFYLRALFFYPRALLEGSDFSATWPRRVGVQRELPNDNSSSTPYEEEEAGTFWRVWHAHLGGASPLLYDPAFSLCFLRFPFVFN